MRRSCSRTSRRRCPASPRSTGAPRCSPVRRPPRWSNVADVEHASEIVVGTRGFGRARALLGSVAARSHPSRSVPRDGHPGSAPSAQTTSGDSSPRPADHDHLLAAPRRGGGRPPGRGAGSRGRRPPRDARLLGPAHALARIQGQEARHDGLPRLRLARAQARDVPGGGGGEPPGRARDLPSACARSCGAPTASSWPPRTPLTRSSTRSRCAASTKRRPWPRHSPPGRRRRSSSRTSDAASPPSTRRARRSRRSAGAEAVKRSIDDDFASLVDAAERRPRPRPATWSRRSGSPPPSSARAGTSSTPAHMTDGCGTVTATSAPSTCCSGATPALVDAIEFDPGLRRIDVGLDLALPRHGAPRRRAAGPRGRARRGATAPRAATPATIACSPSSPPTAPASARRSPSSVRGSSRPGRRVPTDAVDHAHRLLALGTRLLWAARDPAVIVLAGVTGSGKSTLARALAARSGLPHLNSDVIRKRLAGVEPTARAPASAYSPGHERVHLPRARPARRRDRRNGDRRRDVPSPPASRRVPRAARGPRRRMPSSSSAALPPRCSSAGCGHAPGGPTARPTRRPRSCITSSPTSTRSTRCRRSGT